MQVLGILSCIEPVVASDQQDVTSRKEVDDCSPQQAIFELLTPLEFGARPASTI